VSLRIRGKPTTKRLLRLKARATLNKHIVKLNAPTPNVSRRPKELALNSSQTLIAKGQDSLQRITQLL
jgi:hypothetical protein